MHARTKTHACASGAANATPPPAGSNTNRLTHDPPGYDKCPLGPKKGKKKRSKRALLALGRTKYSTNVSLFSSRTGDPLAHNRPIKPKKKKKTILPIFSPIGRRKKQPRNIKVATQQVAALSKPIGSAVSPYSVRPEVEPTLCYCWTDLYRNVLFCRFFPVLLLFDKRVLGE